MREVGYAAAPNVQQHGLGSALAVYLKQMFVIEAQCYFSLLLASQEAGLPLAGRNSRARVPDCRHRFALAPWHFYGGTLDDQDTEHEVEVAS